MLLHMVTCLLMPRQVRRDFREALKLLLPVSSEYGAAMAQWCKYSHKEGLFGDANTMSLTQGGSDNVIPTHQFWADYGDF